MPTNYLNDSYTRGSHAEKNNEDISKKLAREYIDGSDAQIIVGIESCKAVKG